MNDVYLLLGSNQGTREENMLKAKALIARQAGEIVQQSSLYETEAWGVKDQQSFLNQAMLIKTTLAPTDLLRILKQIEKETGRVETTKWGPRIIDIDILFYGHETVDIPELKIPHPYIQERRFTLVPMAEIAPGFVHPVLGNTMEELLEICVDESTVNKIYL
jgi:2-amino-4-hydroxy-6-hydroxymethyldihydropteridine diphosphokinase